MRAARPQLVGIAAMHALETDEVLALADRVRALAPGVPVIVGGHTAAAYPEPFLDGRRSMRWCWTMASGRCPPLPTPWSAELR